MPDGAGVLSVFDPFKTRVFPSFLPVVQKTRKMTKFHLVTPQIFSINILFGFVFYVLISKFENRVGDILGFKTKIQYLKYKITTLNIDLYIQIFRLLI